MLGNTRMLEYTLITLTALACAGMPGQLYGPQFDAAAVERHEGKLFDPKVALDLKAQYDGGKSGPAWRVFTRNYILSKAPDAADMLNLVEKHEDVVALWHNVAASCAVAPERVQRLARELWGHLNLCLTGDARTFFANVPEQEGFEAWRKVLKLVRSRSEVRRMERGHGLPSLE